jgi:ABC-type Mn2+/Zn2+ transport system ATPase subunit
MTNPSNVSTTLADDPVADYEISIKSCNNIDEALISLRRSALNIKYGPNGIGKSTIARALVSHSRGDGSLNDLLPFKHRSGGDHPSPTVGGADDIQKVFVFDERYVSQFVFQRDEVLKNSFEIFINTDEYREGLQEIQSMFQQLKDTFSQSDFEDVLSDFTDLRDAFGVTKSGVISKTSRGFKALGMGGKLKHIPEPLKGYEGFLHSDNPAGWITWQAKGREFLDLSDNCPFCSTSSMNKETAKKVSEEYESAAVKNMSAIRSVIDRLGSYFESNYLERLDALTTSIVDLSPEGSQFLAGLRGQIEIFLSKLTSLRGLSFHALQDVENLDDVLRGLKIDLSLLDGLNSEATRSVVELINEKIDEVAIQINEIRRRIGIQKTRIARLIKENQDGINDFLSSAGYQYSVLIQPDGESYRMILEHNDSPGHLEAALEHLSYGEKNAFALVLFMYHVRRDKPDLVVLDDPVSSFDKTKKFAILHQLFHGKESIRGFTSLLLTHDI